MCDCNGNVDPALGPVCNTTSGECMNCLNNTAGPTCNECLENHFGNPLIGDCKREFWHKIAIIIIWETLHRCVNRMGVSIVWVCQSYGCVNYIGVSITWVYPSHRCVSHMGVGCVHHMGVSVTWVLGVSITWVYLPLHCKKWCLKYKYESHYIELTCM